MRACVRGGICVRAFVRVCFFVIDFNSNKHPFNTLREHYRLCWCSIFFFNVG